MADPVRFELELLGDSHLRRYRRMRPEVEAMPWDTLRPELYPPDVLLAARKAWTTAAFQEYRTGTACTEALHLLLEARAPLDLIALATRFPLDEMVHVELCARMAMALGGATEIIYEPGTLAPRPDPEQPLLVQAAELVTVLFCVGEALSIPLLRGTWHAARHPAGQGHPRAHRAGRGGARHVRLRVPRLGPRRAGRRRARPPRAGRGPRDRQRAGELARPPAPPAVRQRRPRAGLDADRRLPRARHPLAPPAGHGAAGRSWNTAGASGSVWGEAPVGHVSVSRGSDASGGPPRASGATACHTAANTTCCAPAAARASAGSEATNAA